MTAVVIDASVSASWLLSDETNDYGLRILAGLSTAPAFVPGIWDYEMRNILVVNQRRGRIDAEAVEAALELLSVLNVIRDRHQDWGQVVALSRQYALSVYDAAYLELAIRLDLQLATFDKALRSAAQQLGRLEPGTSAENL